MERRQFLRLVGIETIGLELDIDRLLWIPGTKTIFLPSPKQLISYTEILYWTQQQIMIQEMNKIIPGIKRILDRDKLFYQNLGINRQKLFSKLIEQENA